MEHKLKHKEIEHIDIILIIIIVLAGLFAIDYLDFNEVLPPPLNIADEPLILLIGIILGYLIAKFRFVRLMKKALET